MENNEQKNKKKKIAIFSSILSVVAIIVLLLCIFTCSGKSKKGSESTSTTPSIEKDISEEETLEQDTESSTDDIFSGDDVLILETETETDDEDSGFIKNEDGENENLVLSDDIESKKEEEKDVKKEEVKKPPISKASTHKKTTSTSNVKKTSEKEYKAPKDPMCLELERLFKEFKNAESDEEKNKITNEALDIVNKVISKGLDSREAHFFIAQDYINKGQLDNAMNELNKAIKLGPDYLFYYYLGKLLYTKGNFNGAIKAFKKSCELNMHFAPSRYNLGLSYVKVNKIDQALSSYKQAITIKPNYEQAYLGMGRLYKQVKFYDEAITAYKKVIEINNKTVSARMDMGVIYNERGDYPKAIKIYKEALQYSEFGEIQTILKYNLSVALYNNGDFNEALTVAKESYEEKFFITDNTEEANITYNYGLILETCEHYEEAVSMYKEALTINKNHLKAKINLSALYMKSENPDADEVLRLLNEAYVVAPYNFEVNNNMGNAYVLKEDYKNAVIYLNNALTSHPDDKIVKQNLASSFLKAEDYENAEKIYLEIIQDDSENWQAYLDIAKVYIQLNRDDKAMYYLVYLQKNNSDFKKEEVEALLANLKI